MNEVMATDANEGPCLACGTPRRRLAKSSPCVECGFVFHGVPEHRFDYESEYDEHTSYNGQPAEVVLAHYRAAPNTRWALDHLARLRAEGASSLFELGASQGAFLSLARTLGYSVHGVELASASIAYGHEVLGLRQELEAGVWRGRRDDERPVDVVCAFEVLEHSEDPLAFLAMMRSWVKPGGAILISVPNGRRLSVRVGRREAQDFPPHHLMYWTSKSLRRAVVRSGLSPIEVTTSALTHSDLLNIAAPKIAARRAVDSGAFRPVGEPTSSKGLPTGVKRIYPVLVGLGKLVARGLDTVPELGQRLMIYARA
jgi:2-polyprenyl-3-methyl-5-hydroxy-6-metoxy-1,4-benzoquinol methylase